MVTFCLTDKYGFLRKTSCGMSYPKRSIHMDNSTDRLINARVSGCEVASFYEILCSRLNLPKPIARRILIDLEARGHIEIIWKSPRGARFFIRKGCSNSGPARLPRMNNRDGGSND